MVAQTEIRTVERRFDRKFEPGSACFEGVIANISSCDIPVNSLGPI